MSHTDLPFAYRQDINPEDSKQHAIYGVDDDETALLDPSVFAPSMMQQPSMNDFSLRKDSFASSHPVMSPTSHNWGMHHFGEDGTHDDRHNAYASLAPAHHSQMLAHPPAWPMRHASEDGLSNELTQADTPEYIQPKMERTQSQFDHAHGLLPQSSASAAERQYIRAPQVQSSMSSQHTEYMMLAQQEHEARTGIKRMRRHSPTRSMSDMQKRDGGIHKKNKRVDIPQERNIQTIDQMIESTKDEELLKELKGQKRLLRNREAALASRQRKKKHTEDLETKERDYQTQIAGLQAQMDRMAMEREDLIRDRQILIHQRQDAERQFESAQMEKRDMIMRHTEDTASLRKKIQVLSDQLDAAPTMSTAPSSTGFTDFNAEMEALNMGPHDWDGFMLMPPPLQTETASSDASFDTIRQSSKTPSLLEKSGQNNAQAMVKAKQGAGEDQPVASGLLFMLLLFGAFVASKGASTTNIKLPAMPQEVRNAAPTVLHSLLSEASASNDLRRPPISSLLKEPMPSAPAHGLAPRHANRMTQMHRSLTAPTRQQEIDSAFALTPSQYAAHTNFDMTLTNTPPMAKRTLGQALADQPATHAGGNAAGNGNKAEIYTRSLLWEQIPADVVNQFKELVKDHQEIETREQRRYSHVQ